MSDDTAADPAVDPGADPAVEPTAGPAPEDPASTDDTAAPVSTGATSMTELAARESAEDTDTLTEADEDPEDPEDPDDRGLPLWQESLLLVGVALVLAIILKAFFVQAFYIPSESMEPGLVENDRILVQKPSYWGGGSPQRGDVVVFEDPGGWLNEGEDAGPSNAVGKALAKVGLFPAGGHLVKRVIGVAGDTIVCCDADGRISVNGHALDEDGYIKQEKNLPCNGPQTGNCAWTAGPVPQGKLFVMGDNRNHSGDSSAHLCTEAVTDCTQDPYVDVDTVTGKVMTLVWPISHWGFLHRPDGFDDIPDPD